MWAVFGVALVAITIIAFLIEFNRSPLPVIGPVRSFTLTNQLGAAVGLASLHGSAGVANVIFSRCPTQCPKLAAQMARVQQSMPPGARLLTLTADPGYDTPEVLARYGRTYHTDPARWWFLTGTKAEVYRLAIEDFKFNLLESAEPAKARLEDLFIHSTDFAVFDRVGQVRAVVHGEEPDAVTRIVTLLRQLQRESLT